MTMYPPRRQLHRRLVYRIELPLHLVASEQRQRVAVGLHALGVARHQHPHERLGGAVTRVPFHQDLLDFRTVEVPDRPLDQIPLFMDERRRRRGQRQFADLLPQAQQVVVVALDLGLGAILPRGAQDHRHAVGQVERFDHRTQPFARVGGLDLAADPAAPHGVGHKHAIAPGEGDVCRQRRALVAAFLLGDLHEEDLASLDHLLNAVARRRRRAPWRFVLLAVAVLRALGGRLAGLLFRLLFEQRLPVGDRNLVVVGMDLVKGEETVAVAVIVDEGGLQRGFDPRDLRQIDVALQKGLVGGLEVELFELVAIDDDDPRFLRVGRVDKHALCHCRDVSMSRRARAHGGAGRARRESSGSGATAARRRASPANPRQGRGTRMRILHRPATAACRRPTERNGRRRRAFGREPGIRPPSIAHPRRERQRALQTTGSGSA